MPKEKLSNGQSLTDRKRYLDQIDSMLLNGSLNKEQKWILGKMKTKDLRFLTDVFLISNDEDFKDFCKEIRGIY